MPASRSRGADVTWTGHSRSSSPAWRRLRSVILKRDKGICHLCGQPGADVVDHLTPWSLGGTDDPSNLAAAHDIPCHRAKSSAEGNAARSKKYGRRPLAPHPGTARHHGEPVTASTPARLEGVAPTPLRGMRGHERLSLRLSLRFPPIGL